MKMVVSGSTKIVFLFSLMKIGLSRKIRSSNQKTSNHEEEESLVACDNQVRGINSHHFESKIRRTGEISTTKKEGKKKTMLDKKEAHTKSCDFFGLKR